MTILFFSATGNCLSVAKHFDGELKSIPQLERAGEYNLEDDVIGIIAPVYNFTLPLLVRRYLEKAKLKAGYIFGILTFGNMCGGAAGSLVKTLEANGNRIDYTACLKMVDTFLPIFKVENQLKGLPKKNVEANLADIKQDIDKHVQRLASIKPFQAFVTKVWGGAKMESDKGVNAINHTDEKFSVTDSCNACGTCESVCPVSNITVETKPVFHHHCESCYACTSHCPKGAIQLKGQRSEARFRNSNITVKEIIKVNGR